MKIMGKLDTHPPLNNKYKKSFKAAALPTQYKRCLTKECQKCLIST